MTRQGAFVWSCILSLGLTSGALAAAGSDAQDFATRAAAAGLYEVRAAEVARQKAQDPRTRELADQMLQDHQKANRELRDVAKARNWSLPAALEPEHQQMVDRLASLEGTAFDREFARQMRQSHQEAVALFTEQSERGTDLQLKTWAAGKLPTLESHLEEARALESGDGRGRTPGRSQDRSTPPESAPRGTAVPEAGAP